MLPLDQKLMTLSVSLAPLTRAYKAACDKIAAEFGLSQATAWPVVMIGRLGDGVRPGRVADALGLEPSSLVRVIDQLLDSGLLERHDDPLDRRAKTLHLTAAGRAIAEQIETALPPFRRQAFGGVDEADIDACLRVFDRLGAFLADRNEPSGER